MKYIFPNRRSSRIASHGEPAGQRSAPKVHRGLDPLQLILLLPVRAYRLFLSPWVGYACRYQPTCSAYATEAITRHGACRGGWLALKRIARCHPWGGSGHDPVPKKTISEEET